VDVKHGEKGGNKWNKYDITASDGIIYQTFSDTSGQLAADASRTGSPVEITAKEGKYGWELTSIKIIGPTENAKTQTDVVSWDKDSIITYLHSAQDMNELTAHWKTVIPYLAKLGALDKAAIQAAYDKQKILLEEKLF
jgi:hypothetical protein